MTKAQARNSALLFPKHKTCHVARHSHLLSFLLLRAPLEVGWHAADAGRPRLSGPHPKRSSPSSSPSGKFLVRSRTDTA